MKAVNLEDVKGIEFGGDVIILAKKPWDDNPKNAYLEIVLAVKPGKSFHPFVVWGHNLECGGYFSGDYFKNIVDAVERFEKR